MSHISKNKLSTPFDNSYVVKTLLSFFLFESQHYGFSDPILDTFIN